VINTSNKDQAIAMKTLEHKQEAQDIKEEKPRQKDARK
jgi:hypothetical protein